MRVMVLVPADENSEKGVMPDEKLLAIARKIIAQGYDWGRAYADIPWKNKLTKEEFERFKAEANGDWGNDRFMSSHGVNVAMGLKAPAVKWRITGEKSDRDAATLAGVLRRSSMSTLMPPSARPFSPCLSLACDEGGHARRAARARAYGRHRSVLRKRSR